jgi:hypothetical protein
MWNNLPYHLINFFVTVFDYLFWWILYVNEQDVLQLSENEHTQTSPLAVIIASIVPVNNLN